MGRVVTGAGLLSLLLAQTWYSPQESQALFAQANDAYYRQDYTQAIQGYTQLLEHGAGGSDLLFNLGTAHLARGDLGHAVLYLERARRLSRDEDIEAQLATARARQIDQVVGATAGEPFIERVASQTEEAPFGWGLAASLWLACGAWLVLRRRSSGRALPGTALAAALLGAMVCGLGFGAHVFVARTVREGVIVSETAKVREAPLDNARSGFELHSGLKVRITEESGRFARVRLPNGLDGWVDREAVVEI